MHEAAKDLRFEEAARLRDEINELKRELKAVELIEPDTSTDIRDGDRQRTSVRSAEPVEARVAPKWPQWRSTSTDRHDPAARASTTCENVDLDLPRDRLIVFTGLSGSGKSSLAFDTIYAEGQRRYVESLSAYARQFLGQMDKPDVDFIEGLSPAISIDQKSASRNPRSTVGTITEIYDYLRLLYARIGIPHCPNCGRLITRQTPQQIVDRVLELPEGTRFQVLAPVVRGRKGEYEGLLDELAKQGFTRARIDGEIVELADRTKGRLARYENHTIEVVVDRLVRRAGHRAPAHRLARDRAAPRRGRRRGRDRPDEDERRRARDRSRSPSTSRARTAGCRSTSSRRGTSRSTRRTARASAATGSARASRSTPSSSSPTTTSRSPTARSRRGAGYRGEYFDRVLDAVGDEYGFSHRHAVEEAEEGAAEGRALRRRASAGARPVQEPVRPPARVHARAYEGVIPWLERRHTEAESDRAREQIEGYMREVPCPACGGARLRPASLAVTIGGQEHLRGRRPVDPQDRGVLRRRSSSPSATG